MEPKSNSSQNNQTPNPTTTEAPQPESSTTPPVNPDQNQVAPPPAENKTSKKMTILTILLLIFVYLIGLIVMWIGTKWPRWIKILVTSPIIIGLFLIIAFPIIRGASLKKQETKYPNVYVSPTPIPTMTQVDNKRVVNERGGYSFILPNGWKSKYSSFREEDTIYGKSFLNDLGDGDIRITEQYKSLDDYLSHDKNKPNFKSITIDGVPGVIADFTTKDSNIQISGRYVVVFKDGRTYTITLLNNDTDSLNKFQQLLNSLKFEKIEKIPCSENNACPAGYSCKTDSSTQSSESYCKAFF